MDAEIDHPEHGRLVIKRSVSDTGFENVLTEKKRDGTPSGYYYGKCRLDLNFSKQTKITGTRTRNPYDSAIALAAYLKNNPPVPKVEKKARIERHRPKLLQKASGQNS